MFLLYLLLKAKHGFFVVNTAGVKGVFCGNLWHSINECNEFSPFHFNQIPLLAFEYAKMIPNICRRI